MPATLVADIGGSSSRWGVLVPSAAPRIIDGLPGYNPAVGDPGPLMAALEERFRDDRDTIAEVYAYGAGCGTVERATRLAEVLLARWPEARVDVASDLMGAAHGLLGDRQGCVLILGTGMNAGWYNGSTLHQPMPSVGYILGDEGSGADIGKHAVIDALHGRMPVEVMRGLFPDGIALAQVIDRTYRGSGQQAWFASFAGPLAGMMEYPYVQRLITSRLKALVDLIVEHFEPAQLASVVATGSVAFGLRDLLAEALGERGMTLNDVQSSPLPGLLRYRSAAAR